MRRILALVAAVAVLAGAATTSAVLYPIDAEQSEVSMSGTMVVGPTDGVLTQSWTVTTPSSCTQGFDSLDLTVTAPGRRAVTVARFTEDQLMPNALGGYSAQAPESVQSIMDAQAIPIVQWAPYELALDCVRSGASAAQSWRSQVWFTSDWTFQSTDPAQGVTGSAAAWTAAQAARSAGSGHQILSSLSASGIVAIGQTLGLSLGVRFTGVVANASLPQLSGTGVVGQPLKCSPGEWSGTPSSVAYQWMRAGRAITGASTDTYTPVSSDVAQRVNCRVTATSLVNSRSAESSSVSIIWPPLTPSTLPVITGTPAASMTVTCASGTWSESPNTETISWALNGSPISGARSRTLILSGAQVGGSLTCTISATTQKGSTGTATSAAVLVQPAPLTVLVEALVVGDPTVGQVLTCLEPTFSDTLTKSTIVWLADGTVIPNQTGQTLTLTSALATKEVGCAVTGQASSNRTATSTSTTVTIAYIVLAALTKPSISGTVKVGQTVTCLPGTWNDSVTSTAFSWILGSKAIAGATGKTFAITASQASGKLSCLVSVKAAGNRGASIATAATLVALGAPLSTTASPTISGTATVGKVLTATAPTYKPAAKTVDFQWYRNGKAISGATSATYKLVAADKGTTITVKTVGGAPGYEDSALSAPSVGKKVT